MRRARAIAAAALVLAAAVAAGFAWALAVGRVYESHFENVMGTSLDVRIHASSTVAARDAEGAVLSEIDRLSRILSGYDPASEFSRWMRSPAVPTKVSPELAEVLSAFDEWRARTSQALDLSAEAFSRVWKRAALEHRLPTPGELTTARALVRERHWIVDVPTSTATRTSDAPVLLNSFTKSYIVDRAARRALQMTGIRGVLLNAGGDVVIRGTWTQTIGIADPVGNADNAPPLGRLAVRDAVVATSGSYKRGFDIGGRHYSHVIDPRTGWPAGDVSSATVVSRDAIEAGAMATAFCVLTPAESAALARTRPGVEYALVLADGSRIESPGWRTLQIDRSSPSPSAGGVATLYASDQAAWIAGWQLTITLELAPVGGMARRPYVAVWIEDKDHFPVRTIALWYDGKSRYLPELRGWYRADRLRSMAEGSQIVDAVTTATRSAGKYTLVWDGKDNTGKPVRAGAYTVCIEAAREHGTYQIIRQDVDFSGTPKHIDLPGGTEINVASLDYQQVGR